MAEIFRIRTVWSGAVGGTGYTNMFFGDPSTANAEAAAAAVATFWDGLKTRIPAGVNLAFDTDVPVIEATTGTLTGSLTLSSGAITGQPTGSGAYAAPAGASIEWRTGAVKNGRRVTGRTYVVPLVTSSFDTDGTLTSVTITALENASLPLTQLSGPGMMVWSRPSPSSAGSSHAVNGRSVPDQAAVLRSRRD